MITTKKRLELREREKERKLDLSSKTILLQQEEN